MNLKEIAALAGVSTATVSNVVNGNYHKVSAATREKIEKIIKEADYKPSLIARTLATSESRIIGLIVPYISHDTDFMENPYFAHMIAVIERYMRNHGYYLMLRCVQECSDIVKILTSMSIDGAIFLGVFHEEVDNIREKMGNVPVVFVDTYFENASIVNVGIDDYRGGYLQAKYLLSKGHRKIALATPEFRTTGVIRERFRGFTDACRESDFQLEEEDIFLSSTIYKHAVGIGQDIAFSKKNYTAVASFSDMVAFAIMDALKQCGKSVPEDVSVIGFDNIPETEVVTPKLTTVSQDYNWKGEKAAQLLLEMIEGNEIKSHNAKASVHITERQSVKSI